MVRLPLVTLIPILLTLLPPPRQVMNRAVAAGAVAVGTSHYCRHLRNFCDSGNYSFFGLRDKKGSITMQGDSELSALLWGQHSFGASIPLVPAKLWCLNVSPIIRQTIKIAKTVRTCCESLGHPVDWLGQSSTTATCTRLLSSANHGLVLEDPAGRQPHER